MIRQKNIAARGCEGGKGEGGLFSLYFYIENFFLKSSCQKTQDRFHCNTAGMFLWWPSKKIAHAIMIRKKHGRQGQGLFPLYISI